MTGAIVQINISPGGLPKRGIGEALITPLGLEGDACAHPSIHGGPIQAVLLICSEAVDELAGLGYPVFYGALGENLTTRGIDRKQMRLGQRYRVGQAVIELTKMRAPCRALDIYGHSIREAIYDELVKAGDPTSARWGMSGFYAAVLEPGVVRQNDRIILLEQMV